MILRSHSQLLLALARFGAAGNEIHIVRGNHDFEFDWPEVQQHLRDLIATHYAVDIGYPDMKAAAEQRGDIFGEMALVEGARRSADVVAEEPTEMLRLDAAALERLRRRFPFTSAKLFQSIARILSERLRDTTRAMAGAVPDRFDG